MDIQEIESKFEELLLANPDFDESLLQKDEDGCYEDFDINSMYQMFEAGTEVGEKWQAAKAPESNALLSAAVDAVEKLGSGDFVLVPKEPSEFMVNAGGKANSECLNENAPLGERLYRHPALKVYKAMIEAQEQSHD